jgi:hypothetical protein
MRVADNAALWSYDHCRSEIKAATDQELEACCELITHTLFLPATACELRAARRPKPPTLKEQALAALKDMDLSLDDGHNASTIRKALEALPND